MASRTRPETATPFLLSLAARRASSGLNRTFKSFMNLSVKTLRLYAKHHAAVGASPSGRDDESSGTAL
jgi:hypothetical protein